MIDVILCIRRRDDVTLEDFHLYWQDHHAALVKRHADKLGVRSYVQHHTVATGLESLAQGDRGCPPDVYDGVAVITRDSLDDMAAMGAQPDALAAAAELSEDERRFIDHGQSRIWFAEHLQVV